MENQQKQRIINKLRRLATLIEDDNCDEEPLAYSYEYTIDDDNSFESLLHKLILDCYPQADKEVELEFNPPYRYVSYEGELGFTWDLSGDITGNKPRRNKQLHIGQVVDGDGSIVDLFVIW